MHQEPLTKQQEEDLGDVVLVKRDFFSPVWFVPLIAALIGAYLLYETVSNAGVQISILFESGDGIEAGSTKVMFKGLPVGMVDEISVNQNLQGVTVKATIHKNAASLLKRNTSFWLVQPQISLSGVSGLDSISDGRSFATFDMDRDGFTDILLTNTNDRTLHVYRNRIGDAGSGQKNFVAVKLVGANKQNTASKEFSNRDGREF